MRRTILNIVILILFISLSRQQALAQKTDTIIHINGNVLTGDFKKMVYGVVTWKMDGMGTISLEEVKINTIKSDKLFEIKMKNGFIYFGSFDTSGMERRVNIVVTNGRETVDISEIVEVYPIKRNFWMRTSGSFSLGANYSKGSKVATIAFSGGVNYRKKKSYFDLSWDDNNTYQGDTLSSTKTDVVFAWQRFLKNKWSTQVSVGMNQNSELGTKLRVDLNVIGLKDIAYSNWNRLYAGAGFSMARETPYDNSDTKNDLAGLFTVVWKVYKYSLPKVWVDADVSFLPYITDVGRYRAMFNLNPKISILSDNFKIGFSFYYSYDSKPSSDASSTNDYGINLELSYSFH